MISKSYDFSAKLKVSKVPFGFVATKYRRFYISIDGNKYSFLKKNSIIDCFKLKGAKASKLLAGKYEGQILEEDFNRILELVKLSPRHSYMYLKMLGIQK